MVEEDDTNSIGLVIFCRRILILA